MEKAKLALTPTFTLLIVFTLLTNLNEASRNDVITRFRRHQQDSFAPFIPLCGEDEEDEFAEAEDSTLASTSPQNRVEDTDAIWLGFSSKLFGGFFNLTISGSQVRPFGRCAAISQKFSLIEQTSNGDLTTDRCYRCMFVDRRSSPLVVQMRTTALQCLAAPNNAGADTLYRVCAALSPSLPLLTLLKISEARTPSPCPFETGNYKVSYEFSNCEPSPHSPACIDRHGVNFELPVGSNWCQLPDRLRGSLNFECLAHWKAADSALSLANEHQHSFAFVKLYFNGATAAPQIRCAMYHLHKKHHVATGGFSMAIASGFDCSELSGVVLKQNFGRSSSSGHHIFNFMQQLQSETLTTQNSIFSTTPVDNLKQHQENQRDSASCQLPSFLTLSKNWHSIDASSYHLVVSDSATITIHQKTGEDDQRITLHLQCFELEIGGDPSSRLYQAVYQVLPHSPASAKMKRSVKAEFTCSKLKNITSNLLPPQVEAGTAKRAQRGQPTSTPQPPKKLSKKISYRCVKLYQRDRHVLELHLGSLNHGPSSSVCSESISNPEHRVLLADRSIFSGHSRGDCLSIPVPAFSNPQQQHHHHHLQTMAIRTPLDYSEILQPNCLSRICEVISSGPGRSVADDDDFYYLLYRKDATCSSPNADQFFYAVRQCAYRWRRDYVTDNLLLARLGDNDDGTRHQLSCFILQHNGIASTISKLYPNPNCWLNGQELMANTTANSNKTSTLSQNDRGEFIGFAFNAQEACHWPSEQPKFVNSNNNEDVSAASTPKPGQLNPHSYAVGSVASHRSGSLSPSSSGRSKPASPDAFWRSLSASSQASSNLKMSVVAVVLCVASGFLKSRC